MRVCNAGGRYNIGRIEDILYDYYNNIGFQ